MKIRILLGVLLLLCAQHMVGLSPQTTALFAAAKTSNLGALNKAIKAGANLNGQDGAGNTPLVYAVTVNMHPEILAPLIDAGAKLTYTANGKVIDIVALSMDKAIEDYRYINILKTLLEAASLDDNAIDEQIIKLENKYRALNSSNITHTKSEKMRNNIVNARKALSSLLKKNRELQPPEMVSEEEEAA